MKIDTFIILYIFSIYKVERFIKSLKFKNNTYSNNNNKYFLWFDGTNSSSRKFKSSKQSKVIMHTCNVNVIPRTSISISENKS